MMNRECIPQEPEQIQGFRLSRLPYTRWIIGIAKLLIIWQLVLPSMAFAESKHITSVDTPTTSFASNGQSNQTSNIDETLLLVVGIVASILTLTLLIVLGIMNFHHRYIEPERVLEHIKANIDRTRNFVIGSINDLIAGRGILWMSFRAARKNKVSSHSQLAPLPEGIVVIKRNTTKPLAMLDTSCPNCGNYVRFSATVCSNCGFSLTTSKTFLTPTNNILPESSESIELIRAPLPVTSSEKELDEEVSEIVHIDLKAQTKLYLLWDKAGR